MQRKDIVLGNATLISRSSGIVSGLVPDILGHQFTEQVLLPYRRLGSKPKPNNLIVQEYNIAFGEIIYDTYFEVIVDKAKENAFSRTSPETSPSGREFASISGIR